MLIKSTVGGGGEDRQNIPDGGTGVGKEMEVHDNPVGVWLKGEGDGEMDN